MVPDWKDTRWILAVQRTNLSPQVVNRSTVEAVYCTYNVMWQNRRQNALVQSLIRSNSASAIIMHNEISISHAACNNFLYFESSTLMKDEANAQVFTHVQNYHVPPTLRKSSLELPQFCFRFAFWFLVLLFFNLLVGKNKSSQCQNSGQLIFFRSTN